MRDFARLYLELDASTATQAKLAGLKRYLAQAPAADAAWAVYSLAGGRPRQLVPTRLLRQWACEQAGLPDWLFEESYQAVGDLAETIAHILPPPSGEGPAQVPDLGLADWVEQRLLPLRGADPVWQREQVCTWWRGLDAPGRFLLIKLMGGGFRVGVSRLLVTRALAEHAGLDAQVLAQRMMGYTQLAAADAAAGGPGAAAFEALVAPLGQGQSDPGQPYPFFLAHPLDPMLAADDAQLQAALGAPEDWLVEWKVDGIRAQVIRREGRCWIWTRGEELVTDRYPEVVAQAQAWPDGTVLDGELLVWPPDELAPRPFAELQRRIGRRTLGKRILAEAPVSFLAYDVLEWQGLDVREQPQQQRRLLLESLCQRTGCRLSHALQPADGDAAAHGDARDEAPDMAHAASPAGASHWAAWRALREQARTVRAEGLMLKHRASRYGVGRTRSQGVWWKWKLDPLSVDAVLIYAQRGHGRRASVYTDYTFAVWSRPPRDADEAQAVIDAIARREPAQPGALQLLPFAKAYSGLTDAEFAQVDQVIRRSTLEKFGPVRSVRPSLVFEIGFEGLQASSRHKSGVAVRFPRMLRLRPDKPLHEADSLASLHALIGPPDAP